MKEEAFFFSHFPINFGESEMRRIFQSRGNVTDVFVTRKLNTDGKRLSVR